MDEKEIRAHIIFKLYRRNCWGEKHTAFENIIKGIPTHLKGDYEKVANQMIKERFLRPKPTGYGLQISLEPAKSTEITKIAEEFAMKP